MYDDELTKTILEDLEWERNNALQTGCRPETAFTTMLIHGAADFLSNEWDGAELKHLVAALWDVVNSEMARLEAEDEKFMTWGCPHIVTTEEMEDEAPQTRYYHTQMGYFEGKLYILRHEEDIGRYYATVNGVESVFTEEEVEDSVNDSYEIRLIKFIQESRKAIHVEPKGFNTAELNAASKITGRSAHVLILDDPFLELQNEALKAGLPVFGQPPKPTEEKKADEEPKPEPKSADSDDFLNPGRNFTKNIMRDWGQL